MYDLTFKTHFDGETLLPVSLGGVFSCMLTATEQRAWDVHFRSMVLYVDYMRAQTIVRSRSMNGGSEASLVAAVRVLCDTEGRVFRAAQEWYDRLLMEREAGDV